MKKRIYIVETKNTVYWTPRKIDAIYHHVQYKYGQAKFKEIDSSGQIKPDKRVVHLDPPISEFPEMPDEALYGGVV